MKRIKFKKHWTGFFPMQFVLVLSLSGLPYASAYGAEVYSGYDTNRDGYLDRAEFVKFVESERNFPNDADLWQFDKVDTDGDGKISGQEMTSALMEELKRKRQKHD